MLGSVIFMGIMYFAYKEAGFMGIAMICLFYGFMCAVSLINQSGR